MTLVGSPLQSGLAMVVEQKGQSVTQTRDVRVPLPLHSEDMRAFIVKQTEGFQRATAYEVGLFATNMAGAKFAEAAVRKLVEDLCEAIRREKAATLLAGTGAL
jgi:hypothetical protein